MYLFCDLETTGLDAGSRDIIEMAFILCEGSETGFEEIASYSRFVRLPDDASWDRQALKMHQDSGLLCEYDEAVEYGDLRDIKDIGQSFIDNFLDGFVSSEAGNIYLAARNPQFDRAFINKYMPKLGRRLHYRMFDVTTLCMVDPSLYDYARQLDIEGKPHWAMYDIRRDLEVAREFVRRRSRVETAQEPAKVQDESVEWVIVNECYTDRDVWVRNLCLTQVFFILYGNETYWPKFQFEIDSALLPLFEDVNDTLRSCGLDGYQMYKFWTKKRLNYLQEGRIDHLCKLAKMYP